ncbi:MAG: UDP-2,3-diacylglucosamine diphosphatase [Cyclobacteriaceae bacterium]
MDQLKLNIPEGKKIYFASDFHLGAPDQASSRNREQKIVKWLEHIRQSSSAIFLLGDVFDFWFEYPHVVPKGHVRFLGKLAELCDQGVSVYMFLGNHDMWMKSYLKEEVGAIMYPDNLILETSDHKLFIGHGDGYGPGDLKYKTLKKLFRNPLAQWGFKWLHPNIGFGIAKMWSSHSRSHSKEEAFLSQDERLIHYCKQIHQNDQHDYYVFGHRHMVIDEEIDQSSRYFNLGEWVSGSTYGILDVDGFSLQQFNT